jgi:uncharacterized protein YggE
MNKGLLLSAMVLLCSVSAFSQEAKDRPLVTVSGQAEVMVVPDEVAFNLRVVSLDKDLLKAQAKNDEVVTKLLALARSFKIPPEQVQTDYINLDTRYSDEEATKKPSVFLGYTVTKKVVILLRDVTKAEQMLSEIFKSGISHIDSVDFRSTQIRKYKDQARALAMKAAQEKASAMAKEIGQTIGKAHSIEEQSENRMFAANASSNIRGSVGESYSEAESTIALGRISITARVIVSFELR